MTDDTLTAALDEIRERRALIDDPDVAFAVAAKRMAATMRDFPRLLAALDEVLKLTEQSDEVHRDLDGNPEHGLVRIIRCDVIREAISRALLGEESSDA